jgi:hypothetical protein
MRVCRGDWVGMVPSYGLGGYRRIEGLSGGGTAAPNILMHGSLAFGADAPIKGPTNAGWETLMNPLWWTLEHQVAWFLICLIGAILGLLFAWFQSPFYQISRSSLSGEWSNSTYVFLV